MAWARHDVPPANTGTGSRLITYEGEITVQDTTKNAWEMRTALPEHRGLVLA